VTSDARIIEHPAWCSPTHCQADHRQGRCHYSRPVQARGRYDDLTVTVQLFQGHDGDPAHVHLAIGYPAFGADPETDIEHAFDPELAQALGRMLLVAGRQAAREAR
jgi:hypothetical protein